ncbi:MAG: hypothetical protein KBA26_09590 [Candidatus Delongbacteria bacterium]|nr:hypothetical protein [Candidatus Delongbacteria bacterium]
MKRRLKAILRDLHLNSGLLIYTKTGILTHSYQQIKDIIQHVLSQ